MLKRFCLLCSIVFIATIVHAQENQAYENEVKSLVLQDSLIKDRNNIILFTGSSSVRLWPELEKNFPNHNVLNRGFGGSTMRDMLYFTDLLILRYNPTKIFIYEGDNDLGFAKRTPEQILASADSIMTRIRAKLPTDVKVYFISPKPSIARWHLKDQYTSFNKALKAWTQKQKNVYFIDVWTPMLNADGSLKKELFVEDGLHMNRAGYDIWRNIIAKTLK